MTRPGTRSILLVGTAVLVGAAALVGVFVLLALRPFDSTETTSEPSLDAIDEPAPTPTVTEATPVPSTPARPHVPEVTIGVDGWLFFTEDVDPDCERLGSLVGLARLGLGPETVRSIVNEPKSAFHADRLNPADLPAPCVAEARETVRDRFATDALAIDVDGALRDAQRDGSSVFSEFDSHWTPAGRMVAAETLIDSLEPGLWDPDAVTTAELPELQDLNQLLGIGPPGTIEGPTVDRGPVTVDEQTTATLLGSSFITSSRTRSDADRTIPGVTLLVGDSQLAHLLPEIESYFSELVFINWFLVELDAVNVGDQPASDRLIVQSVERDAVARFDHPVLDELAARLRG